MLAKASVPAQDLDEYSSLPDDLAGSVKRWMEWMELERPEEDVLPGAHGLPLFIVLHASKYIYSYISHDRAGVATPQVTGSACPSLTGCCCFARCARTG